MSHIICPAGKSPKLTPRQRARIDWAIRRFLSHLGEPTFSSDEEGIVLKGVVPFERSVWPLLIHEDVKVVLEPLVIPVYDPRSPLLSSPQYSVYYSGKDPRLAEDLKTVSSSMETPTTKPN